MSSRRTILKLLAGAPVMAVIPHARAAARTAFRPRNIEPSQDRGRDSLRRA